MSASATSEEGFRAPGMIKRPFNSLYRHLETGTTYKQTDFPEGTNWVAQLAEETDPLFKASPADSVIDSGDGLSFLANDGTYKEAGGSLITGTRTLYVSTTSGDDGTAAIGDVNKAYKTIQAAVTYAETSMTPIESSPVDIVIIEGEYTETVTVSVSYVNIKSYHPESSKNHELYIVGPYTPAAVGAKAVGYFEDLGIGFLAIGTEIEIGGNTWTGVGPFDAPGAFEFTTSENDGDTSEVDFDNLITAINAENTIGVTAFYAALFGDLRVPILWGDEDPEETVISILADVDGTALNGTFLDDLEGNLTANNMAGGTVGTAEIQEVINPSKVYIKGTINLAADACHVTNIDCDDLVFTAANTQNDYLSTVISGVQTLNSISSTDLDIRASFYDTHSRQFLNDGQCRAYLKLCSGGNNSFGGGVGGGIFTGIAYNCRGLQDCFGENFNSAGRVYYCTALGGSFGGNADFRGHAYYCIGGGDSFGLDVSSGARIFHCEADSRSFGANSMAGTIHSCIATGNDSFGGNIFSGVASNCTSRRLSAATGSRSFGELLCSGEAVSCTTGRDGFGGDDATPDLGILSGIVENCSGRDNSFGSLETSGTVLNCSTGDDRGFTGSLLVTGRVIGCHAGDSSFCSDNGAQSYSIAGLYKGCTAGDESFGYTNNAGTITMTGQILNCIGGNNSFLYISGDGTLIASGLIRGCVGGTNCLMVALSASSNMTITTLTIEDCRVISGLINPKSIFGNTNSDLMLIKNTTVITQDEFFADHAYEGTIIGCDFKTSGVGTNGVTLAEGAIVSRCTFVGNGAGEGIDTGGGPINAKIWHTAMTSLSVNITNGIAAPNNVVDALINL